MPTPQKERIVAQLKDDFTRAKAVYLTEMTGLDVAELYDLRTRLRETGARLQVAKNTLLQLSIAGTAAEGLRSHLTGPTAVLFCGTDTVAPAKAILDFGKDHQHIALKAAFVDGRVYGPDQAQALANLPPVEQLRGLAVSAIAGPLNGLVGVLNGAVSSLVFTLQAIAEKRQAQEA